MRRIAVLLGVLISGWGCGPNTASNGSPTPPEPTPNLAEPLPTYDLTFVAEERVGAITPATGPADLRQAYGADQVRDTTIYMGEGYSQTGVVIFPDRPERLELVWLSDSVRRPEIVYIRRSDSPWTSRESGVHIGTTLEELQALNGRPFTFSGFDWDYGGTVTDWNGGKLEDLQLRLAPAEGRFAEELQGDRPVSSDHPAARSLGIRVDEIYVVLNRPLD